MAKSKISTKRLAIDKANATMIIAVSIAAFVLVFSIIASKTLLEQRSYQSKVIGKKKVALKQLKKNLDETKKLETSYQEFAGSSTNILGGNPQGTADKDGQNSRIVLDALPSKYDFPALATSLEKVLKDNNYNIESITGKDDEVAQGPKQSAVSPKPVEIPFSVIVSTNSSATKSFLQLFERSIRPIQIQKLTITGGGSAGLKVSISAKTFYQPEKKFDVKTETVKRTDKKTVTKTGAKKQ